MPGTCDGADLKLNLVDPSPTALVTDTATSAKSAKSDETCKHKDKSKCGENPVCGWTGKFRPKSVHPPLWARTRPAPGEAPPFDQAAIDAVVEARGAVVPMLRGAVDALIAQLEQAASRNALACDEEELLAILKRWRTEALGGP